MKRKLLVISTPLLVLMLGLVAVRPAQSFLPAVEVSGNTVNPDHWATTPVTWRLNPTLSAKVNMSQANARAVIQDSFFTWDGAPNTGPSLDVQGLDSSDTDPTTTLVNLICFVCSNGLNFSSGEGVLAVAVTTVDTSTGVISQGGIFFNPTPTSGVCFVILTSSSTCPVGSDLPQDLQTVATHEIGHFFGLDHSSVVRAVMFPFAPSIQTDLSFDDVAGISSLYPKPAQDVPTGTIQGTVKLNNTGVFGAHVFADSTTAANPYFAVGFVSIRKSPIGTLTLPDGTYSITGVPLDSYIVSAEPLNDPMRSANVGWAGSFGKTIDTGFTTRSH
jgi:hypothetical protein